MKEKEKRLHGHILFPKVQKLTKQFSWIKRFSCIPLNPKAIFKEKKRFMQLTLISPSSLPIDYPTLVYIYLYDLSIFNFQNFIANHLV